MRLGIGLGMGVKKYKFAALDNAFSGYSMPFDKRRGRGVPAKAYAFRQIIDMIRLMEGKYAEHWGISNLMEVAQELRS